MVRSFTRRVSKTEESYLLALTLIEIEDVLVLVFVVEENLDGRFTV